MGSINLPWFRCPCPVAAREIPHGPHRRYRQIGGPRLPETFPVLNGGPTLSQGPSVPCWRARLSAADPSSLGTAGLEDGEGTLSTEGPEGSRKELLHEALKRLTEDDLESAAQQYSWLHEELFAELDFARVNAFSADPFGGNPAAVVYLPYMPADDWLQQIAAEFNLSETAYVVRRRARRGAAGEKVPGGGGAAAPILSATEDGESLRPVSPRGQRSLSGAVQGNEFDLRWFTPCTEVKLCGHATLAAAHLLFSAGLVEPGCDTVIFHTLSGALSARSVPGTQTLLAPPGSVGTVACTELLSSSTGSSREKPGAGRDRSGKAATGARPMGRGVVELSFPLLPLTPLPQTEWRSLEAFLGLPHGRALWAGRNSIHYILVEVGSAEEVLELEPDLGALAQLPVVGVMVTAPAQSRPHAGVGCLEVEVEEWKGEQTAVSSLPTSTGRRSRSGPGRSEWRRKHKEEMEVADFVVRFFAPQAGIDEDPVTGSAFCSLGPFWAERLGRTELRGFQASARAGSVGVSVDTASQAVRLQGWAVTVQAGVLMNTVSPRKAREPTTQ